MLALHSHCLGHEVPIPCTAYPLVLIALNHTRQWEEALAVVEHAEATLLPFTPLPRLYPIYHAAIDCAGNCHQPAAALALYERMRAAGLPPKVETYTALVNAFAKPVAGDTAEGLAVVRRLHAEVEEAGLSLTQPLYRGLIRAYLRCAAEEDASRLMKRFVQLHHDAASHFFVLSVCVEYDNVDSALTIMDRIRENRQEAGDDSAKKRARRAEWTLRIPVYNRVLDLCVRHGKWKAVKQLWDMKAALRILPNLQSYYLVAQALKPQSSSWQSLLAQAVPQLRWTATAARVQLSLEDVVSENQAAAMLWWALKAVQVGYEGWGERELRVEVGKEKRAIVRRVAEELGVKGEHWLADGAVVSWSRRALQKWKDSPAIAASPPQPREAEATTRSDTAPAPSQQGLVHSAMDSAPATEKPMRKQREVEQRGEDEMFAFRAEDELLVAA